MNHIIILSVLYLETPCSVPSLFIHSLAEELCKHSIAILLYAVMRIKGP
jgi:hypothetical protein